MARVKVGIALLFALAFLAAAMIAGPANASARVALVIGNATYQRFGDLRNPGKDAWAMAETLQSLGFTLVGDKAHVDATRRTMLSLLGQMEDLLEAEAPGTDTTALVYYSGHGVAEAGSNWLVPSDDDAIHYREDVPDFAIGARSVMRRLEGRGGGLNILILDACRNNPLASRRATRGGVSRGLAPMNAPSNTVIAYAAAPGQVAYDGEGELSPFTGALIEAMGQPGKRLVDVLGATAAAVERATAGMPQGRQEPWLEMKPLQSPFYFTAPIERTTEGDLSDAARLRAEEELLFWESIKDRDDPEDFRAYLDQYPEGRFNALAQNRLRKTVAPVPSPESVELALGLEHLQRRRIQVGLASEGFDPGLEDGAFGPGTRSAIRRWQSSRGLKVTGYLNGESSKRLLEAEVYATQEPSRSVTVQYFPKDLDRGIVEAALRGLGVNLVIGTTQVSESGTNAIWFGQDVSVDDVKLIAMSLIRSGVGIKAIRPFRNPGGERSSLVQVGADRAYANRPALTSRDVQRATRFVRTE